jgi:hypothetical protein
MKKCLPQINTKKSQFKERIASDLEQERFLGLEIRLEKKRSGKRSGKRSAREGRRLRLLPFVYYVVC